MSMANFLGLTQTEWDTGHEAPPKGFEPVPHLERVGGTGDINTQVLINA